MKPFSTTVRVRRPGKSPTAMAAPRGRPTRLASSTADKLTRRLRKTMASRSASPPAMSTMAVEKLVVRVSMGFRNNVVHMQATATRQATGQ